MKTFGKEKGEPEAVREAKRAVKGTVFHRSL